MQNDLTNILTRSSLGAGLKVALDMLNLQGCIKPAASGKPVPERRLQPADARDSRAACRMNAAFQGSLM